jgi:transcriptional regulator of arginine metabolism
MKEKPQRLQRIKDILTNHTISGQDELLKILLDEGYDLTQATLSRDLKFLKVAKIADESGNYRYIVQTELNKPHSLESGFLTAKFSGNMVVVKTLPGYANPLAVLLDSHEHEMLVGSVAGDDTIFIAMNEDHHDRETVLNFINSVVKG